MKKILLVLVSLAILTSMNLVGAEIFSNSTLGSEIITDVTYLKGVLVNQNPTSADPGSYVDLLFKIENWGTDSANNLTVKLIPEYPFSLDPNENAVKELGMIHGLQTGNNAFLVRYKVRVDEDAIDGSSEIKLRYSYGSGRVYNEKEFDIDITNPRTEFEVIVQDSTASSTTLAIANIGGNTAESVIVSIPEQEGFIVTGTSASIIGNLDAGDYTLASYQIRQTNARSAEENLVVEISYTDLLDIRRTVQKEVSFVTSNNAESVAQKYQTNSPQAGISSGLAYIIVGIVGIVVIVVIIKFRQRKKR